MRLAKLSDIHGNPTALEAALDDVAQLGGADGNSILGDLAAIGFDPAGVLTRLAALPNARFVQGNTDRYVVTGDRPSPSVGEAEADAALLPRLVEVAHSFACTRGYVSADGWFDWLAGLPVGERMVSPDGT